MKINRRKMLKRIAITTLTAPFLGLGYGFLEAAWIQVTRPIIQVPRLPEAFDGLRVAVLADIHHSSMTSLNFVSRIVDTTQKLEPDVILMVGDFVEGHSGAKYFEPCLTELDRLRAPFGVFSVPGNHDYWNRIKNYRAAIKKTSIQELTNDGLWIRKDGCRIRIAGVDDLWCGQPSLSSALGETTVDETSLLLCHNPDFVERIADPRVGLVLSGHTHGGQIRIPFYGGPVPSSFGTKYLKGLVKGPVAQVYVSRGLGTVGVPLRFRARPEIALVTLTA